MLTTALGEGQTTQGTLSPLVGRSRRRGGRDTASSLEDEELEARGKAFLFQYEDNRELLRTLDVGFPLAQYSGGFGESRLQGGRQNSCTNSVICI